MVKAIDNIKAWAKENVQLITILPENTILKVDTRLKDVLEASVDEKYYLSDEKTALLIAQLEEKDKHGVAILKPTRTEYGKEIRKAYENGEIKESRHNMTELVPREDGISNTITTVQKDNYLVEGLPIKEATKQGYALAVEGDAVNFQFPKSQTRRGRVGKQMANTSEASGVNQGVVELQQYSDGEGISYNIDANYAKGTSVGDIGKGRRTHVVEIVALTERRSEEAKEIRKEYQKKYGTDFSPRRSKVIAPRIDGMGNCVTSTQTIEHCLLEKPGYRIRKLTPLECFRLQSFPDSAHEKAKEVNSDSQRYKQAGNSVTVNVIHEIAKRL